MRLFSRTVIKIIKDLANLSDRFIRQELFLGYIADENDYTSNFTAQFRRLINGSIIKNLTATSYKVNGHIERKTGTDACIILSNGSKAKMCLFEAKLPRLTTKPNSWDHANLIKNTPQYKSHFSDQIERQVKYRGYFAIWEMFYCDENFRKQSSPFLDYTSTCILHDDAYIYDSKRNKALAWTDKELIDLHNISKVYRIGEMLEQVCICSIGHVVDMRNVDNLLLELNRSVDVLSIKYTEA